MAIRKKQKSEPKFFIPDTGENVMRAVMATKPKKPSEWKYLKREKPA